MTFIFLMFSDPRTTRSTCGWRNVSSPHNDSQWPWHVLIIVGNRCACGGDIDSSWICCYQYSVFITCVDICSEGRINIRIRLICMWEEFFHVNSTKHYRFSSSTPVFYSISNTLPQRMALLENKMFLEYKN